MPRSARRRRRKALQPTAPAFRRIDAYALKGPDGTLDGDVRALLAACGPRRAAALQTQTGRVEIEASNAKEDKRFNDRAGRLKRVLAAFEQEYGRARRCALANALWPSVRDLLRHRSDIALRATARSTVRLEARVAPDRLIAILDEALMWYQRVDAIWEPLEQARRALLGLRGQRVPPPWLDSATDRLPRRGNPQTKLVHDARRALAELDEDQQTEILRLVGLLA